jgi:hypothetical protein
MALVGLAYLALIFEYGWTGVFVLAAHVGLMCLAWRKW